jgi:hypothetical protein
MNSSHPVSSGSSAPDGLRGSALLVALGHDGIRASAPAAGRAAADVQQELLQVERVARAIESIEPPPAESESDGEAPPPALRPSELRRTLDGLVTTGPFGPAGR